MQEHVHFDKKTHYRSFKISVYCYVRLFYSSHQNFSCIFSSSFADVVFSVPPRILRTLKILQYIKIKKSHYLQLTSCLSSKL